LTAPERSTRGYSRKMRRMWYVDAPTLPIRLMFCQSHDVWSPIADTYLVRSSTANRTITLESHCRNQQPAQIPRYVLHRSSGLVTLSRAVRRSGAVRPVINGTRTPHVDAELGQFGRLQSRRDGIHSRVSNPLINCSMSGGADCDNVVIINSR
jgi:hypothetical protein